MAPEAAATPLRVAVTASVVTRTPRLTFKGHRPPAHSRVLTEHLVIPVNVASALRPGPRFCPAHDGLPVTSPAAHPHPCSPHPRSALAGEPDGPGEGVRPSRASRGGPTSRHLAPSETRCPRFQTTARKRGVPRCPDTQLRWAGVRRAPQSSFCAWTGALDTPGQYSLGSPSNETVTFFPSRNGLCVSPGLGRSHRDTRHVTRPWGQRADWRRGRDPPSTRRQPGPVTSPMSRPGQSLDLGVSGQEGKTMWASQSARTRPSRWT